jgi:NAD(P)-dependent dehydrogenase (short-subunit alcohol dehydrogenase family)
LRRLEGKIAVISGALGGMGRLACARFCDEGAIVVGTDLADDDVLAADLSGRGHQFEYRPADMRSARDIAALAEHVGSMYRRVDVLYNNHGVILGKPVLETTEEEWDRIHDVNLKSVFLMTKMFVPLMAGDSPSIINVSSIGGVVAFPNMSAYGAAKGGLAMFSKVLAVDLAPRIRVNAICPGVIDTPMPRAFMSTLPDAEAIWKSFEEGHLVKRVGRPEEVVSLAIWLASDESSFMTGAAIPIDGGWSVV